MADRLLLDALERLAWRRPARRFLHRAERGVGEQQGSLGHLGGLARSLAWRTELLLARTWVLLDAGVDEVGEAFVATGSGVATRTVVHSRNKRLDPYRGVRVGEAANPGPPGTSAKGSGKPQQPPKPPDHYSALEVFRDATPAQLKQAYRKRSLTEHPDKGGTAARFQALERAYRVLSAPTLKAAYERMVAEWEARNRNGATKAKGKGTPPPTAASSARAATAAEVRPPATPRARAAEERQPATQIHE